MTYWYGTDDSLCPDCWYSLPIQAKDNNAPCIGRLVAGILKNGCSVEAMRTLFNACLQPLAEPYRGNYRLYCKDRPAFAANVNEIAVMEDEYYQIDLRAGGVRAPNIKNQWKQDNQKK